MKDEKDMFWERNEWVDQNYPGEEILRDENGYFVFRDDEEGIYRVYLPDDLQDTCKNLV